MGKLICSKCMKVFDQSDHGKCPRCHHGPPHVYDFKNSDDYLKERIPLVLRERKRLGLDDLVGGLECVIINTEPDAQKAADRSDRQAVIETEVFSGQEKKKPTRAVLAQGGPFFCGDVFSRCA